MLRYGSCALPMVLLWVTVKCKYRVCKAEEMKNSIFSYRYGKYWCRNIVLSVLPRKISSQADSTNFLFQIRKVFILFYLRSGKRKTKMVQVKAQEKTALILHGALVTDVFINGKFFTIRCTIFYNYKYLACKGKK